MIDPLDFVVVCTSADCKLDDPCGFHKQYGFDPIARERYEEIKKWSETAHIVI